MAQVSSVEVNVMCEALERCCAIAVLYTALEMATDWIKYGGIFSMARWMYRYCRGDSV